MGTPVVAEGRFWSPEEVAEALRLGAHAVVVGTATTRPIDIVRRFAAATSAARGSAAGPSSDDAP
jgi:putative N-acetylmannosamine-6-phosphate epimerase